MTRSAVSASRLFTGLGFETDRLIVIETGRIVEVAAATERAGFGDMPVTVLPPSAILAPGFIDTQVNGGGGVLLNDQPTLDGIRAIATAHRRFGTTGLLPTLITDTPDVMERLADIAPAALAIPGILGFHLEGPHINPARKGVHRADLIRPLDEAGIARLLRFAGVGRSMVTLAPEMVTPAQIARLVEAGLIVSIGHSDATYDDVQAAVAAGATGVTHLFNAMSQITPREPGLVGAALGVSDLHAGIIADGHHVHAANLRLASTKGVTLMLVTDAMPSVGAAEPSFELQGRHITLRNGRLTDAGGTLAGAHLTMVDAVRQFAAALGDTPEAMATALACAARHPAAYLGLADTVGRIAPGQRADLVAFDPVSGRVVQTWIAGITDPF